MVDVAKRAAVSLQRPSQSGRGGLFRHPARPPAWALPVGLLALGIATRAPFAGSVLTNWDSVQYALGLQHFDVVKHQPHPPGSILYVGLARLLLAATHDANDALTWLSIAAGAAGIALCYVVGDRIFGRRIATVATVLLAASPLSWFYGVAALPYALEGALALAIVGLCWRAAESRSGRAALGAAALLAVAGGVRQTTMLLLLPLWGYTAWRAAAPTDLYLARKRTSPSGPAPATPARLAGARAVLATVANLAPRLGRSRWTARAGDRAHWSPSTNHVLTRARYVIAGGSLLAVLCAGWLVPLFVLSGGVGQYVIASRELSSLVASLTSVTAHGLPALAGNVSFLGGAAAQSAGLAPAAFTVFLLPGVRWPWRPSRPQRLFLWLWAGPALLVYTCLHTGQAGYLLLLWPLVCYATATALLTAAAVLARRLGAVEHRVAGVLVAACALTSAALFLVAPLSPRQAPGGMTAASVRETDAFWRGVQRDLGAYSPAQTVILTGTTSAESFRHATYYLPAYRVYAVGLDREGDLGVAFRGYRGEHDYDRFMAGDAAEPALTLPPDTRRLVILDESIARLFPKTARHSVDATPFRDYWVVETGDGARTLTLPRYASVS